MKAIIWTKYGSPDVLKLGEIEKPVPKDNEVLIKVHAATVTAGDYEARSLKFPIWLSIPMRLFVGIMKPKRITVLGQELAGEIEAVGKDVKVFKVGDAVFGSPGFSMGSYAEYNCMPADPDDGVLAMKPSNMTFDEAATVPTGGLEALHFLRLANIKSGQEILINGAGGSIGTYGIQLAKYYGATVTAVDSGPKLDMLRSIGADDVVDYTKEDFTKSGKTYDIVFDVIGKAPFSGSLKSLNENGSFIVANPKLSLMLMGAWVSMRSNKKVIITPAGRSVEDLNTLKEFIESGELKSVIDRTYPLEETAEAHRYVETGQKKGNVVISIA